jgi:site-specific recombinase XerD
MSVRKMESGGYEVRYDTYDVSGERHQHKKRFKAGQSKDAREFDAAHTLDRTHESDITVGEFMNTWLDHAKQHCRITTYGNYKRFVELYFYKAFDANMDKWRINIRKTKLVKIQKRHIQMFIDWMISEQYSYATVKSAMNGIRVAFLYAASDAMQLIAKNPVSGIVLGGGESHAGQVYNADMIKKMLLDLRGHD